MNEALNKDMDMFTLLYNWLNVKHVITVYRKILLWMKKLILTDVLIL